MVTKDIENMDHVNNIKLREKLEDKVWKNIVKFIVGTGVFVGGIAIAPILTPFVGTLAIEIASVALAGGWLLISVPNMKEIWNQMVQIDKLKREELKSLEAKLKNVLTQIEQQGELIDQPCEQKSNYLNIADYVFPNGVNRNNICSTINEHLDNLTAEEMELIPFIDKKKQFISETELAKLNSHQLQNLIFAVASFDDLTTDEDIRLNVMLTAFGLSNAYNESGNTEYTKDQLIEQATDYRSVDPEKYLSIVEGKQVEVLEPINRSKVKVKNNNKE